MTIRSVFVQKELRNDDEYAENEKIVIEDQKFSLIDIKALYIDDVE